jgi:hypothetical protein
MRSSLYATSTEELAIASTRLREYCATTRARRIKKQIRLLSFASLMALGWVAAEAGLRWSETFAPFPSAFQMSAPEPMVIGRHYLEELPGGTTQAYAVYFGTVPSAAELPHLPQNSIGDLYIAADTHYGWLWTVAPGSSDSAWIGPLKGPLSTMPAGPLLVGHTYPLTLPDGRSGVVQYKGAVATGAQLPREGNALGDLWTGIESRACWIWTIPIGATSPQWIDP